MIRAFKPTRVGTKHREARLFGEVLATKREELRLSQTSVGRQIGRSQSWVSYYEQGRFTKIPVLADLAIWCSVLDLSPAGLLYECGFLPVDDVLDLAQQLRRISRMAA